MPISRTTAIQHFTTLADNWSRSTVALVAAGTVVYVLGSHDEKPENIDDALRGAVLGERDVAQAQVYRYVGLAKALSNKLDTMYPEGDGPIFEVLHARNATVATKAIVDALEAEGIETLDGLADWLGVYQRSTRKSKTTTRVPSTAPPPLEPEEVADEVASGDPVETLSLIADRIDDVETLHGMLDVIQARIDALTRQTTRRPARRPARASA